MKVFALKKKWKDKTGKTIALPMIGVALIVFVLTVAVYFVAAYVADSYSRDNMLSGWSYAYTDRAGAVPSGELRLYNAQNPIITESGTYKGNIYFSKTIHAEDTGKCVVLITDYAPMKIRVNGREVYNNHFDSAGYVGNCYNAIWLEPSTHDREVEVFMKLPLSVRMEAYLTDGSPAFQVNSGLLLGGVLFAAGIAALLVLAVLSAVRHKMRRSLLVAGIIAYAGVAVITHVLPECTYWLKLGAVLHFENITDGLDMFFVSMLETIYCGLETTYENAFLQGSSRNINVMFAELAENAEIDNGYSGEHLEHVAHYTGVLCRKLGMDGEKAEMIATASKLHDLGKLAVPKYIINKQGRFNEEERIIINSHTQFGHTILSAFDEDPLIATAADIALYHHERYDGDGVNGLAGDAIPLEARIVTICDVYDALTTERTYKEAWSQRDAVNYLINQKGKIFDPHLTDLFIQEITAAG